jgi:GNAT superfamily N-acetyltransferase
VKTLNLPPEHRKITGRSMTHIAPVSDAHSLAAARSLIREHVESASAPDAAAVTAMVAALPAPFVPPHGGIWLAWEESNAVGCIALQPLAADIGEIKRMYVRPASRGRGVARALVERAIEEARLAGYQRLRLGTLTTMHAAQNLYTAAGFRPIAPYRAVEFGDTLFYELKLTDSLQSGVVTSPADSMLSSAIAATLAAPPAGRIGLFRQLVREIEQFMAAHPEERPWTCTVYQGTDGSTIFRGGIGHSLVIDTSGRLWRARSYEDFETTYFFTNDTCVIDTLTPLYSQMLEYRPRQTASSAAT